MDAFFFEANILGSEFPFFFKKKKHKFFTFSRKQVDKTFFLNDSNCCCSGEIAHRASFLTGDCVFEATSDER